MPPLVMTSPLNHFALYYTTPVFDRGTFAQQQPEHWYVLLYFMTPVFDRGTFAQQQKLYITVFYDPRVWPWYIRTATAGTLVFITVCVIRKSINRLYWWLQFISGFVYFYFLGLVSNLYFFQFCSHWNYCVSPNLWHVRKPLLQGIFVCCDTYIVNHPNICVFKVFPLLTIYHTVSTHQSLLDQSE